MIRATIILLLLSCSVAGQVIPINDHYYLEVKKNDDLNNYIDITVYAKDHSLLINESPEKTPSFDTSHLFIYQDYNFDGHKDFAIYTGPSNCNEGNSYNIYLWQENKFNYNEALSDLINQHCEPVEIDIEQQRLRTKLLSNCCSLESEFAIIDNKLVETASVLHYYNNRETPFLYTVTTTQYNTGKKSETEEQYFQGDKLYSFSLIKNKKQVVFVDYDSTLYYAFVTNDEHIEMYYPRNQGDFTIKDKVITFKNGNIIYEISPTSVQVKMNGQVYIMAGDETTVKGNWEDLRQFKNVRMLD